MSFINSQRATVNGDFKSRVTAAMVTTAMIILQDSASEDTYRHSEALKVLQQPESYSFFPAFLWIVASNADISSQVTTAGDTAGVPDSQIQAATAQAWNLLFPGMQT